MGSSRQRHERPRTRACCSGPTAQPAHERCQATLCHPGPGPTAGLTASAPLGMASWPPPGGPGPAPSQLAEQGVGWVADKGKGAALGLSRGVRVLQTWVSVGHSARRERHPSENRLALPPGTGLATCRTQGAASRPHPHLHIPRGPRRRLPYRASSRHHSPVPHPGGAARTWPWLLGLSAEVEEVTALQQVQRLQVVLKRAPREVLREDGQAPLSPSPRPPGPLPGVYCGPFHC